MTASFGECRAANAHLDDPSRLESIFREEGYLFFRGVLDAAAVLQVKRDLVQVLQRQGVVNTGQAEPIWTGAGIDRIDDDALYLLTSVGALCDGPAKHLAEEVFSGPAFMFRNPNIRYALPDNKTYVTPAHQDFFFIRGSTSFRTLWIPLMDIDTSAGGLALAAGSHKQGLREHVEQEGVYSYIFRGRRQCGVRLEDVRDPWLTAEYHPGDVLVFHNLTLHWSLPNHSERVRLSIDTRAQPAGAPRTFQMEKSIPELRQYRQDVHRIASAEGASQAVFEAVIIEMMKRGLAPEPAPIRALMAEVACHAT
jgi:hypothetical protein